MLRLGPDTDPVVVVALPLFEEANRTRAFAVTLCRLLAKRGVASVLPDLPGQGESLVPTQETDLAILRDAFRAMVDQLYQSDRRTFAVSFRSGSLVVADAAAYGRWSLAPISGGDLISQFVRTLGATGRHDDARQLRNIFQADDAALPMEVSGNLLGRALLEALTCDHTTYPLETVGVPQRLVRLESDRGAAHRHVSGPPLWRRAEPDNDPALAALLADDIAEWIATCEG